MKPSADAEMNKLLLGRNGRKMVQASAVASPPPLWTHSKHVYLSKNWNWKCWSASADVGTSPPGDGGGGEKGRGAGGSFQSDGSVEKKFVKQELADTRACREKL